VTEVVCAAIRRMREAGSGKREADEKLATLRAEIWQGTNRTVIWLVGTMIALSGIVLAIVRFAH